MSRLQLLSYVTLVTLVIGWFLLSANSLAVDVSNLTLNAEIQNPWLQSVPLAAVSDPNVAATGVDIDAVWTKAVCKGQKLFQAMTVDEDAAARFITPMPSPFDGNMVKEFREWGYKDSDPGEKDDECDFDEDHKLKNAFRALGIDTRSSGDHGPNECFQVDHRDADIVHLDKDGKVPEIQMYTGPDGKEYRETNAWSTIGVNPKDGILYFINRFAPESSAIETWMDRQGTKILSSELPLLRSSSDIAWGFWNRASWKNLKNIQKIMAITIVNSETYAIIKRIMEKVETPPGQPVSSMPRPWPGTTITLDGDEDGMALLGSPNGLGAGYFLVQHKRQLGGNKIISKIIIFEGDDAGGYPQLLFWVADAPGPPEAPKASMGSETGVAVEKNVVERSRDGKNIVREHVFTARL